jgi:CheY-like chemotaxis protein
MMPGLTGLELIERVRGDAALYDLPIVVILAHKDYLAKACAGGATRAISKPVEAASLKKAFSRGGNGFTLPADTLLLPGFRG